MTSDNLRSKYERTLADRVRIMKGGRLIMKRTKAELEAEDLEKLYLDYMYGTEDGGGRAAEAKTSS